jgi:hypothetical protein
MQAQGLLHKLLEKSGVIGHKKRLVCLIRMVESVTREGKLSLTNIGRHLSGAAKVKHKIKAVNNLLGNRGLVEERGAIYELLTATMIGGLKEVLVLVDWSSCESHEHHILKASVVLNGRSMTLYEEVHPEKNLGKYKVHKKYLKKLKEIIPLDCHVIIETDAGFRTEWFELVLEKGWDFIGRLRSNMLCQFEGEDKWISCSSLYSKAKKQAKYLGNVLLSKGRKLRCSLYLYKEKGRKKQTKKRKILSGKMDKSYAKANREPWLLATSLSGGELQAKQVVNRYRGRMKIEHEFRDTKNGEWGVGLEYSRTKDIERLELLLLIGHLAIFILWATGLAAEKKSLQYSYQANTEKKRRVLSLVFLGLQVLWHAPKSISQRDIVSAFNEVRKKAW